MEQTSLFIFVPYLNGTIWLAFVTSIFEIKLTADATYEHDKVVYVLSTL